MDSDHYPSPQWRNARPVVIVVCVTVAWFVGDRFLGYALDRLLMCSQLRFAKVYGDVEPAAVLLLGDSRAVNTFHAPTLSEAMKARVYSLAYNGCSADVAAVLLADWLERHPAPRVVVVEVTCTLRDASLLKSLKLFAGRSERLRVALEAEYPFVGNACEASHLYRFNTELFLRAMYYLRQSDQGWINRYQIAPGLIQESQDQNASAVRLGRPRPAAVDGLRQIGILCAQKGITARYVIGPYMPLFRDRIIDLDAFRHELEQVLGIKIDDFSRAVPDVACFADNVHMNLDGSAELATRLIAEGVFIADGHK
jgi:hypothetical protein